MIWAHCKLLLQTWVQIARALVSVGHAADLRQALNRACGNSHEDPTQDHVEDSPTASLFGANSDEPTGQIQQNIDGGDACLNLDQNMNIYTDIDKHWIANHFHRSPQAANDTPREIYNDECSDGDTTTTASSPAESDANEFDDWLGVPSDLVCDGADLSKHRSDVSSQSFEEILAAEELLPLVSELEENTPALSNQGEAMQVVELGQISQVSTPAPFLIPARSRPCHDPNPVGQQATAQDSHINTLCNAESTLKTQSQQSTLASQGTKPGGSVHTRAKRDLIDTEISCIAQSLRRSDSIDFFINNCQAFYKGWISLPVGTVSPTSANPNELVVAAFDALDHLRHQQGTTQLMKRLAYVNLIQAINIHKAAARERACSVFPEAPSSRNSTCNVCSTPKCSCSTPNCCTPNLLRLATIGRQLI